MWWVVVGYAFIMVLLASYESSARSKYYLHNQFWMVVFPMVTMIGVVSLFAFYVVLKPTPRWAPSYVVPIVGMLLGNCINGVSLSLNSILTSLVESSREVELLLSFGADKYEASARLVREAIRTGTMPLMNSMAVIGIISIPGMMTGQILGGTSVMQAARYQILIMYLIALASFGTIMMEIILALGIMFDSRTILRTDLLTKRDKRPTFLAVISGACQSLWRILSCQKGFGGGKRRSSTTSFSIRCEEATYLAPKGELTVTSSHEKQTNGTNEKPVLAVHGLSYGFETGHDEEGGTMIPPPNSTFRLLFEELSFEMTKGEMALVSGPSGVGKSTLLRILAGLSDADADRIILNGKSQDSFVNMPAWRKQVRYVPQTKVDIPGTPKGFMKKIATFKAWRSDSDGTAPSEAEIRSTTRDLVNEWGMSTALLDSEWKVLSGGESQRILVAISLASMPEGGVILLDESTSALDVETKLKVEESVKEHCRDYGILAIWISHDPGQQDRMMNTS